MCYCAQGKARQKNVREKRTPKELIKGEFWEFNISSMQYKITGGNKYWALFVDHYMGLKYVKILQRKIWTGNSRTESHEEFKSQRSCTKGGEV